MGSRLLSGLIAIAAFALPAAGNDAKLKKPSLALRSSPRFAFSPARVLFVAELTGGDDVEEYYCPELEWDWDDGSKSVQEPDCDPFVSGQTKIERRFSAAHGPPWGRRSDLRVGELTGLTGASASRAGTIRRSTCPRGTRG
jgi:hypothetical protein